mgnify:CR=1 FL=1
MLLHLLVMHLTNFDSIWYRVDVLYYTTIVNNKTTSM